MKRLLTFLSFYFPLKNNTTILYHYDNPIEMQLLRDNYSISEKFSRHLENLIFNQFNKILVFGESHKRHLQELHGLEKTGFFSYKFAEIVTKRNYKKSRRTGGKGNIALIKGNSLDDSGLSKLHPKASAKVRLYGKAEDPWVLKSPNYMGTFDFPNLLRSLNSLCDYGFVWYSPDVTSYAKYGGTSKLSTYLLSGLPVIYDEKLTHIDSLSEEYGFGLPLKKLEDIKNIDEQVSDSKFKKMCRNSHALGKKIGRGEFTKEAIKQAIA
jgi:hypothetical protein